jgi:hypothetical protein
MVNFSSVEGADHSDATRTQELWSDVASWLSQAVAPVGAGWRIRPDVAASPNG